MHSLLPPFVFSCIPVCYLMLACIRTAILTATDIMKCIVFTYNRPLHKYNHGGLLVMSTSPVVQMQ